jgi:hypothetical protein
MFALLVTLHPHRMLFLEHSTADTGAQHKEKATEKNMKKLILD